MRPQQLLVGTWALLGSLAAVAASAPFSPSSVAHASAPSASTGSHLVAFGTRGAQGQSGRRAKLDATLADLARHLTPAAMGSIPALRSLHPAAHFLLRSPLRTPYVLVDAVTRGDPQQLEANLVALGLIKAAVFNNDVGGWLPVNQLDAAAALTGLHSMRASMAHTRVGAVSSQGDHAQRSDVLRTKYPTLTGAGVTVGLLSDSFNCYSVYAANGVPASGSAGYAPNGFLNTAADDASSGDLPMSVNVLSGDEKTFCMNYGAPVFLPFTDEGRAMAQIVHDVAPGAALSFYTAENSEADFAKGIVALATAGAKVIADDVGYYDEPFYQDGVVAQAIDQVNGMGVSYFSAAGNNGSNAYENTMPSFATASTTAPNTGEFLLNFDTSGGTTTTSLPVTIPPLFPGEFIALVLQWDQPYVTGAAASSPGASSRMDLCITGTSGGDKITDLDGNPVACTGANASASDPLQILLLSNPANAGANTATAHLNVMIGVTNGTPAPTRVILSLEDNGAGATIDSFATHSATLQGHAGAQGGAAVGAAYYANTPLCGSTPAVIESFSAKGGTPILFDTAGDPLSPPVVRHKPDFVGPDGVNTTYFGNVLTAMQVQGLSGACADAKSGTNYYPSFFGTSAATPHAAAIAALMLQANPGLTPDQIYSALQSSAAPMSGSIPDTITGYGFVQADAALQLLPPGPPALSIGPATVMPGAQSTLTW
ncbi:MAG: S8 family serine peptidase, partial [Sinobacteraceae bacterium]|nr:S8 family serine peptidase [Nevskiaceae bacterium]